MSTILATAPEPYDHHPIFLPPVRCKPWCLEDTGHPDAVHVAEQRCRSVAHRLDTHHDGGRDGDQTISSYTSLALQADQATGQPAQLTLGIQLGGTEQWLRLTLAEAIAVMAYHRHLIREVLTD